MAYVYGMENKYHPDKIEQRVVQGRQVFRMHPEWCNDTMKMVVCRTFHFRTVFRPITQEQGLKFGSRINDLGPRETLK